MPYQSPRGTHDILPYSPSLEGKEFSSHAWVKLEEVYRGVFRTFSYDEIRTPIFEDTDLFIRTSGDTSEIVTKQLDTFQDKGDRSCTLKPEGTAPVVRAMLQHNLFQQGVTSRFAYFTEIFRYERPQKGRYRQAHQFGAELVGTSSPLADVEIMELAYRTYRALGIEGLTVRVNSIGRAETRERFRTAILGHVQSFFADKSQEDRDRAERNPLRLLDTKDPALLEALKGLPPVLDFLEDSSRAHFDQVLQSLTDSGVTFEVDPGIVRGLDYYTDTVFEIHSSELGAQSTLCGGGRYDDLVKAIGGPAMPAVGFGAGVERALLVMESLGLLPPPPTIDYYVVAAAEAQREAVGKLARSLRAAGHRVEYDLDGKNLKAQMKAADRRRARYAVILGEDEVSKGIVSLRDLSNSEQTSVSMEDFLA
jgi:histidyl-tRNA synthetase